MLEFLAKLSRSIRDRFVGEPPPVQLPSPDSRSDLEYENLLWALLEEVEQGESWGQLQGFLIANRLDARRLAQWLQSYGDRLLEQPESNQELARRLVKLGQVANGDLGTVARTLGERLLVSSYGDSSTMFSPSILESEWEEVTYTEVQKLNQLLATLNTSENNQKLASFKPMSQLQPDLHEVWYNQGNALLDLGRLEEAISSFDQALKIKPDYHNAWYNRGNVLLDLEQFEEAISSYDQALKIKPDYYAAWYNRGRALSNLGRLEEAISSYNQALKIKPDLHEAWNSRGNELLD
jgi:tetratricopeptide (TPR) repeat protein